MIKWKTFCTKLTPIAFELAVKYDGWWDISNTLAIIFMRQAILMKIWTMLTFFYADKYDKIPLNTLEFSYFISFDLLISIELNKIIWKIEPIKSLNIRIIDLHARIAAILRFYEMSKRFYALFTPNRTGIDQWPNFTRRFAWRKLKRRIRI